MVNSYGEKTVYIIGGSSGIGLSTARILAAMGAKVIIFARTESRLEGAVKIISRSTKSKEQVIDWRRCDVSVNKEVVKVMTKAVKEFGAPDILINCAGRAYPHYFEDISYEQFDETMKVNLYGMWNVIQALLPSMKARGGHIVNVSSVAGLVGVFGYTDYCASKFGVIGFSETLKSEFRRYNIAVSVLCPPDTDTPGFKKENETKPVETRAVSGAAKVMHPDRVAYCLLDGIMKRKFLIIPGFDGKFIYYMRRFFPWIVDLVMEMSIKKSRNRLHN